MEQMDKQQVLHSLSMTDCIRLMRTVLREHAQGKGQQYLRTVTRLAGKRPVWVYACASGNRQLFRR